MRGAEDLILGALALAGVGYAFFGITFIAETPAAEVAAEAGWVFRPVRHFVGDGAVASLAVTKAREGRHLHRVSLAEL